MNPLVITGFFRGTDPHWQDWFFNLWWRTNIAKRNLSVIVISTGGSGPPMGGGQSIALTGDAGHCDDLLSGRLNTFCPACPATWMAGAWLAYLDQKDFLYIEQDCLCFGDWLERLYSEIGACGGIFGKCQQHGAATSLFLISHDVIPQFVQDYLAEGPENHNQRIAERKILRMIQRKPELYCQHSMPFDTDRPIVLSEPAWYAQKFTPGSLRLMAERGLIDLGEMPEPPNHGTYSNHK